MEAGEGAPKILLRKLDGAERLQRTNVVGMILQQGFAKRLRTLQVAGDAATLCFGEF
jgi:hypothetical protein